MIVDHVDGLDIPNELVSRYHNESLSLQHLWEGMGLLNHAVKKLEDRAQKQVEKGFVSESMTEDIQSDSAGKDVKSFFLGNAPTLEWLPKGLLYCYFQWYAISACNYVRLLGWLLKQADALRLDPTEYVKDVIPDVKRFRDKIAAHFVRADDDEEPRANKNASVMYQVGYTSGRFRTPILQVFTRAKGKESRSNIGNPWSLTEVHEQIRNRYSPRKSENDVSS